MVASGQSISAMSIEDLRIVFMYPSDVRRFSVIQLTDDFQIPGLDSNLFSLRAMEAKTFPFPGKNAEVSPLGEKLPFR